MKEDVKGAEQSLAELRAEVDNIKKQASKFEAESRELYPPSSKQR